MIPGQLISILTFPGVIVHEWAHKFFCEKADVPVYKVKYFSFGNPAGYVIHGEITNLKSSFLISVGPLIINTLLCGLIYPISLLFPESIISTIGLWLSISIGMNAFPSNHDANNFLDMVKETRQKTLLYYSAELFALLIMLSNALSFLWFDALYAVGVGMIIPFLLGLT